MKDEGASTLPSGLREQACSGCSRVVAVEQRRRERAIGIGIDEHQQRQPMGAAQRNNRQQANQLAVRPGCEGGGVGQTIHRGVYRQFPVGEVIAIRLDGARFQCAPGIDRNVDKLDRLILRGRSRVRVHLWPVTAVHSHWIGEIDHVPFPRKAPTIAGTCQELVCIHAQCVRFRRPAIYQAIPENVTIPTAMSRTPA